MGGDIEDNTIGGIFNNDEEEEESRSGRMRARIFVGGLGGSVTAEDLRNTFSSLGELESVEIVRSKGRSFAYFDFLPSSPKSLSKLFSTYNGCMWKGGRLRLEKAKEHYLLRLKRELAEDAKLANSAPNNALDATKNMGSSEKLNSGLNPEKMEFRLFFPKLKKVKPLPFSGTGKHKYSFQRIEVPALPIHFCDCEEHYDHSLTVKRKDFSNLETLGGGVDEKELNMMMSVMNKLFERENNLKAACSGTGLAKEGDIATKSSDENETDHITEATKSSDENETDLITDEDNLVMNMVAGGKSKTALLGSWGQETILANEEAIVNELRTSKDSASENVLKSQIMKIAPSDKKRKSPLAEETNGNEALSSNPERKGSVKKTKLESGIQQSNTNISWSQKSPWRDLAGKRGDTSFCISRIIQSTAPTKEESMSDDDAKVPHFTEHQDQNLVKNPTSEEFKSDGVDAPHFNEHQNQNPVEESRTDYGVNDLPFTEHQNQNPVEESRSDDGVDVLPSTEQQNQNTVKNINLESQSCQSQEPNEDVSQLNKPNMALNKPTRGALWLQKSSWTQLVGDTNSSFSISQLLPGVTFKEQKQVEPNRTDASNSTVNNYSKLVKPGITKSFGDGSKTSGVGKEDILAIPESSNIVLAAGLDPELSPPQQSMQNSGEPNDITAVKKNHAAPGQPSIRNIMIGETCSFMRSDASMREWAKTKAALSGSIKKKNK